ncbi:DNA repair protein RecO [Sulfuricystis multivorans]|uniref:DNA repair protein RecO n=1 Tax=Sulfuricystis multivorans TaxID=2211108 RepID=UPI001559EE00|nr:DNA repair protein RecO [Sulfuricystis multivorans]
MTGKQRIDGAAAFLLHSYPFSETSLILEIFAREHGRLALLARGARRPRSALRGVLHAFQPLELAWFGGGEVKTLARAEWLGGLPLLVGSGLLVGYYLNELLMKLLPREDPHVALFDAYGSALGDLARGTIEAAARRFEKILLRELGYGLRLEHDAQGQPIEPRRSYRYQVERGALPAEEAGSGPCVSGQTLLDLAEDNYADPRTLAEAKPLMRTLLAHYLEGQPLQTRRVFIDLQDI